MNDITIADIESTLAGLAVPAPAGLGDRILAAAGFVDRHAVVEGPLGPVVIVFSDAGVTACVPLAHWDQRRGRRSMPVDELPPFLARRVAKALATGRLGDLPVDLSDLTAFQRSVLEKTAEIPPGELRPYGWVAREIGKPGAVRAVGSALNRNPVPILIPCHRVNRGDGHVGNYGYGPQMKRDLLSHEGLDPDVVDQLAERGVRYVGSDTTHVYCLPTCRHARRITDRHRVAFPDKTRAESAGYRPCLVCRPVAA